jgi:hypothetical protein
MPFGSLRRPTFFLAMMMMMSPYFFSTFFAQKLRFSGNTRQI